MNTEIMKSIELVEASLILILILSRKLLNILSNYLSKKMIKNSKFNKIFNISLDSNLDIYSISNNCKGYLTQKKIDHTIILYSIAKLNKNYETLFNDNKAFENKYMALNPILSKDVIENKTCYMLYQELLEHSYEYLLKYVNDDNEKLSICNRLIELHNEFLIKFEEATND